MSSLQARSPISVQDENMKPAWAIFTFALLIFTCLSGIFISIYAIWRIFFTNREELKNVDSMTVNSAASCIILHALTVLLDPIGYWFFITDQETIANTIWLIWDVLWTLSKLNLYFVYIYRCYVTFKNTPYAYSPIKVYIPLCIAWILQLFNMIIFMFHDLDDSDQVSDNDNPLSNDTLVLIAAGVYLFLDIIIVLAVVFLFIYPIIRLMSDLRTKSQQIMTINSFASSTDNINMENIEKENEKLIMKNHATGAINGEMAIELVNNTTNNSKSSESSNSQPTVTEPHSPTKMGAAYYNKHKKHRKIPLTPRTVIQNSNSLQIQPHNTNSTVTCTSIDSKLFKMKQFGRLPCPEDEAKELENLTNNNNKVTNNKFDGIIWNRKQTQILNAGTRLALLSVISLTSGFLYQGLWMLSVYRNELGNFSYTWGFDTIVNIVCIYLSFQFAVKEYDILCSKCCCCCTCCCDCDFNCHKCCFKCVGNMAKRYHTHVSHE